MQEFTPEQQMNFDREQLNRNIESNPNSVIADTMREEKIRNVIAQLNPELLLTEIEHRIRGEKKIFISGIDAGWERIDNSEPISEELVQNYIAFLNAYLTQNNSLSNFSPQEINNIMGVVIDYVRDDLTDNSFKYGLSKIEEIDTQQQAKLLEEYRTEDGFICTKEIPITIIKKVQIGEEKTDYNKLNKIGHIVCQSTFSVLKQAQNGMLASRIFKALRVNETTTTGGNKSKLDFLKFW